MGYNIGMGFIEIIISLIIFLLLAGLVLFLFLRNRQLKVSVARLENSSYRDDLTGLPNQRFFEEYAAKTLYLCRRRSCRMAFYFLNLDGFKKVNDIYGLAMGDLLLREAGKRLTGQMRMSDLSARNDRDDFVALIQDVRDDQGFDKVARRLIEALSAPYIINDREIKIGVSIGISLFPEQGVELKELMDKADEALFSAKESGRGCYRIFREKLAPSLP